MPQNPDARAMGRRISSARKQADFRTAADFAAKLAISVWTVRSWEAGKSQPRYDMLAKISDLTGFPAAWFLGENLLPSDIPGDDQPLESGVYGIAPFNRDAEQALAALSEDARGWGLLIRLSNPAAASPTQLRALHDALTGLLAT